MWARDLALVQERIDRLDREARDARLVALARAGRPHRPGRARRLTAAMVRGVGQAALSTAHWIDARTIDTSGVAWHRS
jgi:hypothetical protein